MTRHQQPLSSSMVGIYVSTSKNAIQDVVRWRFMHPNRPWVSGAVLTFCCCYGYGGLLTTTILIALSRVHPPCYSFQYSIIRLSCLSWSLMNTPHSIDVPCYWCPLPLTLPNALKPKIGATLSLFSSASPGRSYKKTLTISVERLPFRFPLNPHP